jgi:hypothetical protein
MNQIKQNYQHLFEKFSSLSIEYARKNTQLSLIRVFWFVVWMLLIYFSSFYTLYIVVSAIFSGLIVFVFLVVWHNKILKKKNVFDIKRDINQFELKALQHDFSNFDDGKEFIDESHKFTHDLDIFGPFSLFQFLNRCFSPQGRQSLAGRLQKGFDEKLFIRNQQQAINELSKKSAWLQDFRVLGIHAVRSQKKKGAPIIDLSKWGNKKSIFNSISFVILVSAIFLLSTLMLYFLINGSLAFKHFILYMLLPLGISGYFAKKINIAHLELSKQSDALQQWKSVFDIVEKESFQSQMLQQLQEDLKEENDFASLAIKKLHKISQAFDTRLNLFGWFLLNYFMLWDILQSIRLEKWRKKYGKDLEKWFSVLSELEALISLATFKYNHPQSIFPEIVNGDFIYQAQEASHPLLPPNQSVPNDISFSSLASFNIVTGANMAGKSTYLRTVGVNMILSLCGAPVLAKTCKIKPIQMFTSIRTKDNLARNESYFYAELLRLQSIINELKEGGPLFIILDEILKGTNSKDKEMGSKALVAQLIGLQAVGLIATHDLQLGSLINSFPKNVRNLCFEVDIQKDALFFDYKLREGISQNLNATFLMKKMGITGVD